MRTLTQPFRRPTQPFRRPTIDGHLSHAASAKGGTSAIGLVAIAVGLALNTVVGPLILDLVTYPVSASMRNQTIGLDAVALLIVAPACLITARLTWRGHALAPALALSLGSYVSYMFVQYLVGPEYDHYPATLVLHLGLFAGGWILAFHAWTVARRVLGPAPPLTRRHAVAAVAMAGFVVLRYLPGLAASFSQRALPEEAAGDVTMYWLIVVSDLGVFVPIALATALGIVRGAAWARLAMTATVGWFAAVSLAVAGMSFVMLINDDPFASAAQLGLFIVTIALVGTYAAYLLKALLADPALTYP